MEVVMQTPDANPAQPGFELLFASFLMNGRTYAFPCDESGDVDLDHMNERLRSSYLFARASIGFGLRFPVVRSAAHH
jgi:hypothetical protein